MHVYWLFPTLLLMLALGLVWWNVRAWRAARRDDEHPDELEFCRRQFRRRVQVSGMLTLLALGLLIGQLIPHRQRPTLFVTFWFGMLLLVAWVVILAIGDMLLSRQRLAKFQRQRQVEEARLNAELERLRSQIPNRNGHEPLP